MAADIVPKLLAVIQADFYEGINNSSVVKAVNAAIEAGTATHKDALRYAQEVGKILESAYKKHITVAALPDGKMYYNIAKRIIDPTLRADHAIVADITVLIQDALNRQSGIGVKGIKPMANADRIKGFVERLSTEKFDDVSWLLEKPIENFSMAVVDDVVRANADFHSRAGLKPTITRTVISETCDWCSNLAGTYDYSEVKATGHPVFMRHRNCDCLVEYNPRDGTSRINAHTKKVIGSKADIEARKKLEIEREKKYKKADKLRKERIALAKSKG